MSLGGRARRLFAAWVGLAVGGVVLGLIVEGNGFDGAAVRSISGEHRGDLTAAARVVTQFGAPWLDIIFAAVVLGLLIAGRRRDALLVALAGGGAMLLTNAVKIVLERPRPAGGGLVSVASTSWPSGHASSSIALYGVLAALAARRARPGVQIAIWAVLVVVVGLIGASRVYLGVHYPTDVAAGWVLGGLWLLVVVRCLGLDGSVDRAPPAGPP